MPTPGETEELKLMEILISRLQLDERTQTRAGVTQATVEQYADHLRAHGRFPPVVVFHDPEGNYWLADGWHRVQAHVLARRRTILVEVRRGTLRDAILCAVGSNFEHGLQRTNDDKRRAVRLLLADPEWRAWSNREIAERCHVSHSFVGMVRSEQRGASGNGIQMRTCERGGVVYDMDTTALSLPEREERAILTLGDMDRHDALTEVLDRCRRLHDAVSDLRRKYPDVASALLHLQAATLALEGLTAREAA